MAGLCAGYLRGWVDQVISGLIDILLGFPYLIFAVGLMAMMGPGVLNMVMALAYKEWVVPARVVRGETLAARETEYVEAARAIGASSAGIMFGEVLPNILSPVIVVATVRIAQVIILEARLSFLGLGVQPPTPDWGLMIQENQSGLTVSPWPVVVAVAAIAVLTIGTNLVTDGIARAAGGLDRRLES